MGGKLKFTPFSPFSLKRNDYAQRAFNQIFRRRSTSRRTLSDHGGDVHFLSPCFGTLQGIEIQTAQYCRNYSRDVIAMKEQKKYSDLSIQHKRKIIAANRIGDIALSLISQQKGNQLVRLIQRNAISFSNQLSVEEVEAEIAKLDGLIDNSHSTKRKGISVLSEYRRTRFGDW